MIPKKLYRQWLNIDISNKCTLQCSECVRTLFKKHGIPLPGKDLNLQQFDKITDFFAGKRIGFCGTFSDPIYNKSFIEMLKMCKEKNIEVCVHTAASHQPIEWYEKAFESNLEAIWQFGIDGLPESSHLYRKNQDGKKLFEVMLKAKNKGLPVSWQFIEFDYNANEIEEAKLLATYYKIDFLLIHSNRNLHATKLEKKTHDFLPKCVYAEKRDLAYSVTGHITPCCWTNASWDQPYLKEIFAEENHIDNFHRIEDVFQTNAWKDFFEMLKNHPDDAPSICKLKCSIPLDIDPEQSEEWFFYSHDNYHD